MNATEYLAIASAIKIEASVTSHTIRKSLTGRARRDGSIVAPEGKTRRQLFVLAHECAHVVLNHTNNGRKIPRHLEELEAEKWALAALRRHKVSVPRKIVDESGKYIAWRIEKAIKSGATNVSHAAYRYANNEGQNSRNTNHMDNIKPKQDADAVAIGALYRKGSKSLVDSMKYLAKAGQQLKAKQDSLAHGKWLPWLKANAKALGFDTPRTAQRLIYAGSKYDVDVVFNEEKAVQFNRLVWGNEDKEKPREIIAELVEEPFRALKRLADESTYANPVILGGKPPATMRLNGPEAARQFMKDRLAQACKYAQRGHVSGDEMLEILSSLFPQYNL